MTPNALSIQPQAFNSNEIAIMLPHCHHTLITMHYINLFISIKLNTVWCSWMYLAAENLEGVLEERAGLIVERKNTINKRSQDLHKNNTSIMTYIKMGKI